MKTLMKTLVLFLALTSCSTVYSSTTSGETLICLERSDIQEVAMAYLYGDVDLFDYKMNTKRCFILKPDIKYSILHESVHGSFEYRYVYILIHLDNGEKVKMYTHPTQL